MTTGPRTPDVRPKIRQARALRKAMSPPEVRLWVRLRSRARHGLTIRRQHPFGPYILDFYCSEARLAIGVDGAHHSHAEATVCDARRDAWLLSQGIRTLRVQAIDIMQDGDAAADYILEDIRQCLGR